MAAALAGTAIVLVIGGTDLDQNQISIVGSNRGSDIGGKCNVWLAKVDWILDDSNVLGSLT